MFRNAVADRQMIDKDTQAGLNRLNVLTNGRPEVYDFKTSYATNAEKFNTMVIVISLSVGIYFDEGIQVLLNFILEQRCDILNGHFFFGNIILLKLRII
jgi:hypothetical protein